MSTLFLKISLWNDTKWLKIQIICSYQAKLNSIPEPFHGQFVTRAMQMTVKTASHLIFFKKLQDLRTSIALVPGRVVKEDQLLFVPC